jgi:hypothetical protein
MEIPAAFVELLKQAPVLGVFVYVVFALLRGEREERAKREESYRVERELYRTERRERDAEFMQFLSEQRSATLATLDVLAMRLQNLGDLVVGIDDRTRRIEKVFEHHDSRAEGIAVAIEGMKSAVIMGDEKKKRLSTEARG